ncbi:MAG: transketolase [Synergistales bacterium]|nr:transketolase [Synergistales bacterium]
MDKAVLKRLKTVSNTVRQDVIRMAGVARCGNLASSLSIVDILTILYWKEMKIFPEAPNSPERDRFILSKGHGCPALYGALAHRGFFSREELWNYSRLGTMLQGHPQYKITPGVDATTGSLGMGPGIASGMALALRHSTPSPYIYCLTGDGELQSGSFWESVLFASHHGLDKVILIVDLNGLQSEGSTDRILSLEPLSDKFRSFGWEVLRAEGHDFSSLEKAFSSARDQKGSPSAIIARTVPGKGVSFIEEAAEGANRMVLSREEMDKALKELSQDQLSTGGTI